MNEDERHRLNEITAKLHDALTRLEEHDKKMAKELDDLRAENKELRDQLCSELRAW